MPKKKETRNNDKKLKSGRQPTFRRKLEKLLNQIVSEGELSKKLRQAPRQALKELGFNEAEVESLGDVSFDITIRPRRPNLLKPPPPPPPPPCFPDNPTKTIIGFPITVTGGNFMIDLEDFTEDEKY